MFKKWMVFLLFGFIVFSCSSNNVTGNNGGGSSGVSGISVTVVNNSGIRLYLIVNRADNYWLENIGDSSSWSSGNFDSSNCMVSVENGATFHYSFPKYTTGFGCRMYIGDTTFVGIPDLATYPYIYDKVEMGWNAVWNLTSVDFVAIPMQLESGRDQVGFLGSVTRASLIQALQNMPEPYRNLYFTNSVNEIVRFFSPQHFINYPDTLQNCLDSAIIVGLPHLVSSGLPGGKFTYGEFTYSNIQLVGDRGLSATCSTSGGSNSVVTLDSIYTVTVVGNTIHCTPPCSTNQAVAKFAAIIGAAINRGVLYNPLKWGESGSSNQGFPQYYYVDNPDSNVNQYNYYAKVLHQFSINGLCYGHSYDDIFFRDASLHIDSGESVVITILPFD